MTLKDHLRSTHPPYVQLLVLKDGQTHEEVVEAPAGFAVRLFQGKKCRTKSGLMGEFARVLEFPSYFGKNWDAFEECLTDLYWLPAPGYLFIVTDAEQVLADHDEEYRQFITILEEAGKVWATDQDVRPEIPFHVLLTVSERLRKRRRDWLIPAAAVSANGASSERSGKRSLRRRH